MSVLIIMKNIKKYNILIEEHSIKAIDILFKKNILI